MICSAALLPKGKHSTETQTACLKRSHSDPKAPKVQKIPKDQPQEALTSVESHFQQKLRAQKPQSESSLAISSDAEVLAAQAWFAEHVTIHGQPYALDFDQARAACDFHKNTLVTARAGSGKTRVIVAKTAYLVGQGLASLEEIAIFMFNRTAAAEVNERIAAIEIDGRPLTDFSYQPQEVSNPNPPANTAKPPLSVASTFHKFALDIVKSTGERPDILTEGARARLIQQLLNHELSRRQLELPTTEYAELLSIVTSFITRAGQKYPTPRDLPSLEQVILDSCSNLKSSSRSQPQIFLHRISFSAYSSYLHSFIRPQTDFNLLMARATTVLEQATNPNNFQYSFTSTTQASDSAQPTQSSIISSNPKIRHVRNLKYLMIDEYQDFSCLFFSLTSAILGLAPSAHLFAVGDDWQAINRFAGSDVDYFINFAHFFPEDSNNIPLATNYRSHRKIVELANTYMLKHYDSTALPAIPYQRHSGKIYYLNPEKIKFDATDILEDALGDGALEQLLRQTLTFSQSSSRHSVPPSAVKLLKCLLKIFRKHPYSEFMLLHRHNFTSIAGLGLEQLLQVLRMACAQRGIMSDEDFNRQVRCLTMHRSKGLEAEIVILLEMNTKIIKSHHPHATLFPLFGDTEKAESADQDRLIYVALTRAKERLYILSSDRQPLIRP